MGLAPLVEGLSRDDKRGPTKHYGGFTRLAQTVGQEHVDSSYAIANAVGAALTKTPARLATVAGACATDADSANDDACVDAFIKSFGERALHRAITAEDVAFYRKVARVAPFDAADWADVIGVLLAAPEFLYFVESGEAAVPDSKDLFTVSAYFLRHARLVGSLVRRVHPSRSDRDDLVQDTFVAALESLASLKNPQAFAAWVGSLAIRTTHKRLRRRRLAARLGPRPKEEVPWDELIASTFPPDVAVELGEISTILASFPTNERIAFLLRKVEGNSLEEVALATETSLATVKRRIAAAEDRLEAARARVPRAGNDPL